MSKFKASQDSYSKSVKNNDGKSNNNISEIPKLPDTLEGLWCNNNKLTTLPKLPNSLTNLQCQNNELTRLPILPDSLETLSCDNNQFTILPKLPNGLEDLYCAKNQLTNLPKLPNSLRILRCENNNLPNIFYIREDDEIDVEITRIALGRLNIDNIGLDILDHKYLMYILKTCNGGPIGIETIVAGIGEDQNTVEDVIEPYLLQIGFMNRSSKGRVLTTACIDHIKKYIV